MRNYMTTEINGFIYCLSDGKPIARYKTSDRSNIEINKAYYKSSPQRSRQLNQFLSTFGNTLTSTDVELKIINGTFKLEEF